MAPDNTESLHGEDDQRGGETDPRSRAAEAVSTVTNRNSKGLAAMLAGGVLLAWTLRTARRSRGRAMLQGFAGVALLALGFRQRRSRGESRIEEASTAATGKDESDEAYAHRARSDVMGQAETNPRGTSGEPDVETETDPDEGSIRFTEDQQEESGPEPHLDEDGPHDPRMEDDEDEVEIDLSEASMADEASEATGPTSEQAQPSSTEGTEPEPTPAEDASHMEADAPDREDSDAGSDDDERAADYGDDTDDESGDDESEDDLATGSG